MITKAVQLGISPLDLANKDRTGPRLKVWWIPQVPMKPFVVYVNSLAHAWVLLEALAQYDLFQLDNNIKPDYSNVGGVCIWDEGLDPDDDGEKWTDWESDDYDPIEEMSLADCEEWDRAFAAKEAA